MVLPVIPNWLKIGLVMAVLSVLVISSSQTAFAMTITGPSSWYGGPCDRWDNNVPKYKPHDKNLTPGVALRFSSTPLHLLLLKGPNHRLVVVQHTDYGPANWTGRAIDINYTAAIGLGYRAPGGCVKGFPTGKIAILHSLTRRRASFWAAKTKTKMDDRWIIHRR